MKKILLLAVLAVTIMAMPAFASVQNVKVSGDVDTTWLVRDQFDLGMTDIDTRFYQNLVITQTRLRVDADLTDNVAATVALINERVWGSDDGDTTVTDSGGSDTVSLRDNGNNDIDLNLAYVTLREMLYSPLTVIIGRQNFAYGNSLSIDSAGANNVASDGGLKGVAEDLTKRTAMDAVRMILDYNPLTIDVVAAKVADNNNLGTGAHDDDVDLFGANANYQLGDDMQTVVEAYFWAKIDQSTKTAVATGAKSDTVYMPGLLARVNPIKGLSMSAEVAIQKGNKATTVDGGGGSGGNVRRNAAAAQIISNYMLPFDKTAKYNPLITGAYTYLSGDSNPDEAGTATGDDHFTAWDPMFENQSGGTIYNALFDYSNAHIYTLIGQVNPMEDVTAKATWTGLWTDKPVDDGTSTGNCIGTGCFNMRQPDGTIISPRVTNNEKVGDEVDIELLYDYTEDVQFGAKAGWFFPGSVFHSDNDQVASQILVNGNVNF